MRYLVDPALCSGHGACAGVADEVYSLDDAGFNAICGREVEVPVELEKAAVEGADACPDQAIRILN
jgi:ferredoxin